MHAAWRIGPAVLLPAVVLGACGAGGEPPPRPARIILFSMDTVRADRVSGYGDADTTPHLAEIAREGALFRDFYGASSYTIPSHMSVFTGLDAAEHGVASKAGRLAPEIPTMAELLSAAGWRTKAFHEGGYIAARFGFDRGFDDYAEHERIAVVDSVLPDVLKWITDAGDDPYFLFLHTYAAHYPFGGMARYRGEHPERGLPSAAELDKLRRSVNDRLGPVSKERRRRLALYNYFVDSQEDQIGTYGQIGPSFVDSPNFEQDRAEMLRSYAERIRRIDDAIGEIRRTLIELGQWEDTLLIVFSDHGEAFFEHALERHDYVPFNEVLKVPFIVSYPRLLRDLDGRVVEGLTWHVDILPTVLGLAGLEVPAGCQGLDLTRVLQGRARVPPERAIYPAVLRPAFRSQLPLRRVVIQEDFKRIEGHEKFGDEQGLLFQLADDPAEVNNLRAERPGVFEVLGARARAYESGLNPIPPVHQATGEPLTGDPEQDDIDLSEEEMEKLRALGYVE